jgi:nucleoside-diphosphate kinase
MRGLIGEIITRFERKGLILVAAKLILIPAIRAQKLYEMHKGKPFF